MSSTSYLINKWEGLVTPNSTKMQPVIYIQPQSSLLNYARINGNKFSIRISNSKSLYDNKPMIGHFSEIQTCCEDNCENLYTFVLDTDWVGVPLNLGTIDIYGLIEEKENSTSTLNNAPLRMIPSSSNTKDKHKWIIWVIIAILIAILVVLYILYINYESSTIFSSDVVVVSSPNRRESMAVSSQNKVDNSMAVSSPSKVGNSVAVSSPSKVGNSIDSAMKRENINVEITFMKAGLSNEILKNRLTENRISMNNYGISKFRK